MLFTIMAKETKIVLVLAKAVIKNPGESTYNEIIKITCPGGLEAFRNNQKEGDHYG